MLKTVLYNFPGSKSKSKSNTKDAELVKALVKTGYITETMSKKGSVMLLPTWTNNRECKRLWHPTHKGGNSSKVAQTLAHVIRDWLEATIGDAEASQRKQITAALKPIIEEYN